ncbi:Nitrogen permease reactivator protein [Fusarium irregulare]|uniref:non-specific serine/threonine protein kinase n=1 Tax=Fusarium irregulare TaxID=2494466 RepID=A0A9W8UCC5_9HYPO|nr:Nitrogen permease reactivator protein [Fusarium irregulare]KAJ4020749.1 Nitrogen permease reactivator protein [Fusarium irregulare]
MASPNPSHELPSRPKDLSEAPESTQKPQQAPEVKEDAPEDVSGVRFSSAVEEISPTQPVTVEPSSSNVEQEDRDQSSPFTEVTADQLKAFTKSLHGRPLQELRLNNCQFEAFSLPASRVPSNEDESGQSTRLPTPTSASFQSPHSSPQISSLASPPLTPAGSGQAREGSKPSDPPIITPQPSSSHEKASPAPDRRPSAQRAASDHAVRRASSAEEQHQPHRRGMFGGGAGSVPASRESSPSRSSASHFYSKPFTPGGDKNDPYAKGRRPAPAAHTTKNSIDPRFIFSRKKKHSSPHGSKANLNEKRGSSIFGGSARNSSEELSHNDSATTGSLHPGQGSMADLKRFFRKGGHHNKKRESSPAPSIKSSKAPSTSTKSTQQLPFGDDHGLSSKYGKLGKFLGSGAGGSVRLMKRKDDGTVFAVKEFRARHTYETEKEYNKKVTAEFCVGSTLHHGNIIETLDILQEKGRWYEVMEYAPFDLFAIVMTGKMSREEITCCFLQILNGVTYLHSVGLAHRDLKLDNVVVSSKGIMKIIDFGSAHVFKYPFETGTVPAKGIVGSDPYLAPEVYDAKEYDAVAVDIWSLAIIFCCMTLRRFPWKVPRMTDNSFKLFAADPTPGHDPRKLIAPSKSTNDLTTTPARDFLSEDETKKQSHQERKPEGTSEQASSTNDSKAPASGEKKEVIRGPWRILRLLPRESRHIISRMLDLDPKKRASMEEILQEPWVADTVICQQFDHGEVVPAEDHTHILEPPANQQPEKK